MVAVLALAAMLWFGGAALGLPRRLRLVLVAVLWLAVVLINLTLPPGHALREASGNDARLWLVLAGMVALVLAYRAGLRGLQRRADARPSSAPDQPSNGSPRPVFSEAELNRYARHIILHEVGGAGQRRFKEARVLVIGAGGLGAPAMMYLAAAGVGTIGVIDDDVVEASNLQRQIIHTDARIGMPKVFSAQMQLEALNPFITLRPYHRRLTPETAEALFADYDLILDGTDNFDTRYLVNRTAAALGKPLIAAAITQWEGQISLYDPARGGACFECLFPQRPAPGLAPSCAEAGVIAPLPGVMGSMMALEALKYLSGAGEGLRGQMLIHDALYGETRRIATRPRKGCAACGAS